MPKFFKFFDALTWIERPPVTAGSGHPNRSRRAGIELWGRRPLELATLRLQNMIGVSLPNWDALRPRDDQLAVLTQLGGLAIGDGAGGLAYEWKDPGICAVCNFEDALDALDGKSTD